MNKIINREIIRLEFGNIYIYIYIYMYIYMYIYYIYIYYILLYSISVVVLRIFLRPVHMSTLWN